MKITFRPSPHEVAEAKRKEQRPIVVNLNVPHGGYLMVTKNETQTIGSMIDRMRAAHEEAVAGMVLSPKAFAPGSPSLAKAMITERIFCDMVRGGRIDE